MESFVLTDTGSFDDRMYANNAGTNVHPVDLLKLMSFCTGKNLISKLLDDQPYPRGMLSQSWLRHQDKSSLTDYLLLSKSPPEFMVNVDSEEPENTQFASVIRSDRDMDLFLMLMEFCSAETHKSLEKLQEIKRDQSQAALTATVALLLSVLCLVNDRILAYCGDRNSVKWHEFRQNSEGLSKMLAD